MALDNSHDSRACQACHKKFGRFRKGTTCTGCHNLFCTKDLPYLLTPQGTARTGPFVWQEAVEDLQPYCTGCFFKHSSLGNVETTVEDLTSAVSDSLLLLHGGDLSKASMLPLREELLKRNYFRRIIVADLPRHGANYDKADISSMSVEKCITHALHDAGEGKTWIFGHSLGGYMAYEFATKHPASVAGVITSGASVWKPMPLLFKFLLRLTLSMPPKEQHKLMLRHEFGKCEGLSSDIVERTVNRAGQYWSGVIPSMKKYLATADVRKWLMMMSKNELPLLLVNGSRDQRGRIRNALDIKTTYGTKAQAVSIEGGNHMIPISHVSKVSEQIIQFCNSTS